MEKKQPGTLHRTIALLDSTLQQLGALLEPAEVERMGVMIHRGMSQQQRSFHTPEHIFDLADPDDPHGTLAALFHDLVYFQVDQGLHPQIADLLDPFVIIHEDGTVSVTATPPAGSRAFQGCGAIFGFVPGQVLSPFAGLNEFLSALVMAVLLEGIVADIDMLISVACIEATIPFRRPHDDGKSPADLLAARLSATAEQFGLSMDEDDIAWAVVRAVTFANRDVANFAEEEAASFLENTWKLLPETNPELRTAGVYSISSYRVAVQKMRGFLSTLKGEHVFHQYRNVPAAQEYQQMIARAQRNLGAACEYLGIKFLTACVLESLARLTGGDAPIALFMGEIPSSAHAADTMQQISDYLPRTAGTGGSGVVDSLLDHGRAGSTAFDLQNAPLSLFIFRTIGEEDIPRHVARADQAMSDGTPQALEAFLRELPNGVAGAIAGAAAHMVPTRRDALTSLTDGVLSGTTGTA